MISFCITCRNRLEKLKQTLPVSLSSVAWGVRFSLLDYSSRDGLAEWVKSEMLPFIELGVLDYFRADGLDHFDMSHAKNACALLSAGDVVCNLDADNFCEFEFQDYLEKKFRNHTVDLVCTDRSDGTHGRIAIRRDWFVKLGGYDESFAGYGWDDNDFRERASRSGAIVVFGPRGLYREVEDHNKIGDYSNQDTAATNAANKATSEKNVREGRFVANVGKRFGKIRAMKNFEELVEV